MTTPQMVSKVTAEEVDESTLFVATLHKTNPEGISKIFNDVQWSSRMSTENYFTSNDPHHGIYTVHFLTGKSSGILSGISSGILSGISSGISSGICSGISSGISSWHSIWQIFWHSI